MRMRFLRPALMALAVVLLAGSAQADVRDYDASLVSVPFRYVRLRPRPDSTYATQKASYAGISLFDTTRTFVATGAVYREQSGVFPMITLPASAVAGKWSIVDTLYAYSVFWGDGNGTVRAGADSVGLVTQVSADGFVWNNLDSLGVGTAADASHQTGEVTGNITSVAIARADYSSTRRNVGIARFNWDRPQCNFIRWILREDPNAAAATTYGIWVQLKRIPPGGVIPSGYK